MSGIGLKKKGEDEVSVSLCPEKNKNINAMYACKSTCIFCRSV